MKVDYDDQTGVLVVPKGLFDYTAGTECVRQVEGIVRECGAVQITIDFSKTTFMDSSGIGALIVLLRTLPSQTPPIKLVHPSKSVQKLMEVCHLDKLFDIDVTPQATK